jgi:hypothetical protein
MDNNKIKFDNLINLIYENNKLEYHIFINYICAEERLILYFSKNAF